MMMHTARLCEKDGNMKGEKFLMKKLISLMLCLAMVLTVAGALAEGYDAAQFTKWFEEEGVWRTIANDTSAKEGGAKGGFITDALGRKKSAIALSCVAFVGLTTFVLAANLGLAPAIVGISYGFFIGGLWSVSDMLCLIIAARARRTRTREDQRSGYVDEAFPGFVRQAQERGTAGLRRIGRAQAPAH